MIFKAPSPQRTHGIVGNRSEIVPPLRRRRRRSKAPSGAAGQKFSTFFGAAAGCPQARMTESYPQAPLWGQRRRMFFRHHLRP
jgi:hypothetical protein